MLLTLDMGNTNITVGMFKDGQLMLKSRIATDRSKMEDQYAVELLDILRLYGLDSKDFNGAIICSVVPPLNTVIKHAVEKVTGVVPMMVSPGTKTGVNIRIDNPAQLGADLLVGSVAAVSQHGAPCIIWDLGTATTVSVVDRNGVFRGGAIMAGVGVAIDSLVSRASQLPRISLETPQKVIGVNTVESMQSGVVYGTASMIDGMCDRIEGELGYSATIILTGGMGKEIAANCRHKVIYDDDLVLTGLHMIYKKNKI
ncbi:MAG: type III pantothenate kinase [Oscillospiraceae bacterium]|nr:type III pantothenate kinase [Oscillospiraceae bacterium]MDD3833645.1 type III pantothenate kinase [Oscillospiraceae bacterium]MDD4546223.1 type III pantothenate kinase [Oscillospiraceae bacterium]